MTLRAASFVSPFKIQDERRLLSGSRRPGLERKEGRQPFVLKVMDINDFGTNVPKSELRAVEAPMQAEECKDQPAIKGVSLSQWAIAGPNKFLAIGDTYPTLKPGVYCMFDTSHGMIFEQINVCVDEFLEFPNSKSGSILAEIDDFWKKWEVFSNYGFLHRRGFLLYGPAGGGKTVLVQQIIARVVKNGGIVFICKKPCWLSDGLQVFRRVEPKRPVVCVYEDIDALIDRYCEADILSVLDGENQIDRVLNIGTTNYPEKLDKRIVGRPRRFDRVIKIDMPEDDVRRVYFKHKLKIDDGELDEWVKATEDFSFAAMAELVISVKCFDHPLTDSAKTLRELLAAKASSKEFDKSTLGFGGKK